MVKKKLIGQIGPGAIIPEARQIERVGPEATGPSVVISEIETAVSGTGISPTSVTFLGSASRGPKEPVLLRGQDTLIRIFGSPTQENLGLLSAFYSLLYSSNVKFIRVTDGTDTYSQVIAECNPHPAWILGEVDLSNGVNLGDTRFLKITVQDGNPEPVTKVIDLTGVTTLDAVITKINEAFAGSGLVNETIAQKDVYKKYLMLKTSTGEAPDFTIATGDGMSTVFTNILERTPVRKKSVTITTKIDGNTVIAIDDGEGNIEGEMVTSGSINYITGEVTITYSSPPKNGENIVASYEYEPKIILETPESNDATYKIFRIVPPYEKLGTRGKRLRPVFRGRYTGDLNGYVVKISEGSQLCHFNLTIENQLRVVVARFNNLTPFDINETLNKSNLNVIIDVDEPCEPKKGEYMLTGGSSGGVPTDVDYIDTLTTMADKIDTDLLAIPGVYSPDVINTALTLAEQHQTFLVIIDPPQGLTPDEVIGYHNGESLTNSLTAFTSEYGAIYYPWAEAKDLFTRKTYMMPPSLWAILRIMYTDTVAAPWYAPAGTNRGIINPPDSRLEVTRLEIELTSDQREKLQSGGNVINPIIKFDKDIVIWGQRTLYRDETHYGSRINVRRLLIYLRKKVTEIAKRYLFEPITDSTFRLITLQIESLLSDIKIGNGIRDFKVVIDETTTPPEVAARNTIRGAITIVPAFAAETISLEFTISSTLAEFTEK